MAEDTTVVQDDANLDDVSLVETPIAPKSDDTSGPPAADTGKDDAAAANAEDKPADDKGTGDAKKSTEAKDPPADSKPAEGDQTQQQTPEQQQAERDRIAREEYLQRQRTRQNVEKQIDEVYGPKTAEQLVEEGVTPEDARFEALRQEMLFSQQRTQIAELNAGMQAEAVNVLNDFPVFNPNSKSYDEAFTKEVQAAYQTAARLQADENGIVTNAEIPLYDFHKRMAGIYDRGASKGTQQGKTEMVQMLGRTEDTVGGSSSTGSGDSFAELEERIGDAVIT